MLQQMNAITTKPTEVIHLELETGRAIFDSAHADCSLSLADVGAVTIALDEITAAFEAENRTKIQTKRGNIYDIELAAFRMVIDSCGLSRCSEAYGDFIRIDETSVCNCYGCARQRGICTGVK